MKEFFKKISVLPLFIFLAFPVSTNYGLKSYEFGGGAGTSDSTNYSIEGIVGESGGEADSTNFSVLGGLSFVQQANVPPAPSLVNSSSWYNKLRLTINNGSNPSDTTFAVAITNDNWVTTKYVQSDNTVGATLGAEDYRTDTNWNTESPGEYIVGLTTNTTYKVKVKAYSGKYTESGYGPEASAATSAITLSFDIDIGPTSGASTNPPYNVDLGILTIGSVNTGSDKIWVDLDTNAEWGGFVYLYGTYTGLRSTAVNHTIDSVTNSDISALSEAYGLQAANSSGLTAKSPYNVTSNAVGIVDTSIREVFDSGGASVSNGRGSLTVKVKTSVTTFASSDYTDTLTLIASGTF